MFQLSPPSYGTRKFIRVFTEFLYWILSWARWNQSTNSRHVSRGANFIHHSSLRIPLYIEMLMKEYKTVTRTVVHPSTPKQVFQEQTLTKILTELSPPLKLIKLKAIKGSPFIQKKKTFKDWFQENGSQLKFELI